MLITSIDTNSDTNDKIAKILGNKYNKRGGGGGGEGNF